MSHQILEITKEKTYLSLYRGFIEVKHEEGTTRVPIDNVMAVIANAHGLTHSSNLLVALSENSIPFVLCSNNHKPVSILWPIESHHQIAGHIDAQIKANKPLKKRLWQQIIRCKICSQAAVLGKASNNYSALHRLAKNLSPGDIENHEAQAARIYWKALFGNEFKRDSDMEGINSLLNYGYTIIRSTVARSVMAAGLHPALPIFHHNKGNAMRLVDDLMEPYRPVVDIKVKQLVQQGSIELIPSTKTTLASCLQEPINNGDNEQTLQNHVHHLAVSLVQVYLNERKSLSLPTSTVRTKNEDDNGVSNHVGDGNV